MKTTLSLVSLNLCIFITTHSLLSTASDVIYDSAGNKLLKGVPYYIFPLLRGTGGGLTLSRANKDACPLDVTQEPFEFNYGVPFIVTPIIFEETYIRESYPVSIEASFTDPCQGSKTLKLSSSEVVAAAAAKTVKTAAAAAKTVKTVTAGGELNTQESCFQFVEANVMPGTRSYQIQLCPFKCGSNSSTSLSCYNIGLVTNSDGKTFLGQTDALFPVVFQNSFGNSVQTAATQSAIQSV